MRNNHRCVNIIYPERKYSSYLQKTPNPSFSFVSLMILYVTINDLPCGLFRKYLRLVRLSWVCLRLHLWMLVCRFAVCRDYVPSSNTGLMHIFFYISEALDVMAPQITAQVKAEWTLSLWNVFRTEPFIQGPCWLMGFCFAAVSWRRLCSHWKLCSEWYTSKNQHNCTNYSQLYCWMDPAATSYNKREDKTISRHAQIETKAS